MHKYEIIANLNFGYLGSFWQLKLKCSCEKCCCHCVKGSYLGRAKKSIEA